ncbi:MAG: riboflavin synthase [Planctomycetaceae bacterium]|nr:riboflavin synthase [Planctomycetaceae bacterium]
MFTGLVEGLGIVAQVATEGAGIRLSIAPPIDLRDGCALGDSVAINGCCLTVVEIAPSHWVFQAGPETLAKTGLGSLAPGARVNLERSLSVNGRLGGHFVQGHVDGTGRVEQVLASGEWVTIWFGVPAALARQMVPKGSVAVDGVSLTLVDVERERFSVALIPHTLDVTTLGLRQPGDTVNIETDILAKYVEKLLRPE